MAPHAKVFALYDRPFWRDDGLSRTAQSIAGPMAEIHDATTFSGQAALFGFLQAVRRAVDQQVTVRCGSGRTSAKTGLRSTS